MSRWVKKTPLLPRQDVPVRVLRDVRGDDHDCVPPGDVDAGPRSVWECDCGRRWRIAVPYWREMGGGDAAGLPAWVRALGDPDADEAGDQGGD